MLRERRRVVVAHHHLRPHPTTLTNTMSCVEPARALDCFTDLNVDLILGGHLHRAYIGNSLDVYPSKNRESGIIIVHSGTSSSQRGRCGMAKELV